MYFFKETERGLWTVGAEDSGGQFHPESDHSSIGEAADRVAYLNGYSKAFDIKADAGDCYIVNGIHSWILVAEGRTIPFSGGCFAEYLGDVYKRLGFTPHYLKQYGQFDIRGFRVNDRVRALPWAVSGAYNLGATEARDGFVRSSMEDQGKVVVEFEYPYKEHSILSLPIDRVFRYTL